MTEILSSPRNPMVDPVLHVWGWEVALYLFLGGWTAGVMVLGGEALLRPPSRGRPLLGSTGLFIAALAAISLGMLALFVDLEAKINAWRFYVTFQPTSPMWWGAWILVAVYPVLGALVLSDPPAVLPHALRAWAVRAAELRRPLAWASMATGVALGIYTGILLSSLGARPLWATPLLGPLFLVSGLSTAAASVHLVSDDEGERHRLLVADTWLIAAELAVLGLVLQGLSTSSAAHTAAARLVLGGPYTAAFWVPVVAMGLLLPLVLQVLHLRGRIPHTPVAALLVIGGALALRLVVVAAGQASAWPAP